MSDYINDARATFLNLRRFPARLTIDQAAVILGVSSHDIAPIMKAGLLKPLGNPQPNAPKHFLAAEVEKLAADADLMHKVTRAISKKWQKKNARIGHTIGARKDVQDSVVQSSEY